ncbi:MAG: hypothetical protein WBX25_11595 [Rhodomicrobium sp.]
MAQLAHSPPSRLLLIVLAAALSVIAGPSASGRERDPSYACEHWTQNRLVIGTDLQARRFMLEAKGTSQLVPAAVEQRKIFHRTFSLSVDIFAPIALFKAEGPRTVVIARDNERSAPLRIPVFFIGRNGDSQDDLKADADTVAFAPSKRLDEGEDFAQVGLRLMRGGSRFGDIRPFFICGLPGVILCESYCPSDTVALAQSLVAWAVEEAPARASKAEGTLPGLPAPSQPKVDVVPREKQPAASAPPPSGAAEVPAPLQNAPQAVDEHKIGDSSSPSQVRGAILITFVSTDSGFIKGAGSRAAGAFWSGSLSLANAVSEGAWEEKILARAQSFGASQDTHILQLLGKTGKLADGDALAGIAKTVMNGSMLKHEQLPLAPPKPVERFHLDEAVALITEEAGIGADLTAGREALLIISGSIRSTSYFCQHPLPSNAAPAWLEMLSKVLVLEIWSEAAAAEIQRNSLALPAENAPEGVLLCGSGSAGSGKIAVYGITTAALSEVSRDSAFAYLTQKAKSFLKP